MIMFYVFAAVAVGASMLVIAQRNPIYSVLLLIASFGALSGLYVLLDAPFVAVIQIIVYAGAIMVLFLFVVMLLNAPHEAVASVAPASTRREISTKRLKSIMTSSSLATFPRSAAMPAFSLSSGASCRDISRARREA